MTFVSTATSVCHARSDPGVRGHRPTVIQHRSGQIPSLVTARTRAVMAVHYAGQPAELDRLLKVCADHGLPLLEDAAEAAGAEYRGMPVGTFGKSAMFSFTPTKNITTGEGGIVLTSDARDGGPAAPAAQPWPAPAVRARARSATTGDLPRCRPLSAGSQLRKLDTILARKRANAAWMSRRLSAGTRCHPPVPGAAMHGRRTCSTRAWLTQRPRPAARVPVSAGHRSTRLLPAGTPPARLRRDG